MNPETVFWNYIRRHVGHTGLWQRVEEENVPDVYFALKSTEPDNSGWIELKQIERWPVRDSTIVKIDHFTQGQRNWILDARQYVRCHVFLKVGRGKRAEYLLFGDSTVEHIGKVTRTYMYTLCMQHWWGQVDFKELVELIR